jgi:hypothetical protein
VLPLLNNHSWKQLSFKNECAVCKTCLRFYAAYYIHIFEMLILWSWQSRFLHFYIQNIYTQDMYNRPLYTYINVCMYMWPHWKLLHTLCSCAGYEPCGTVTRHFNCSAVNNTVYIKVFVITLELQKNMQKGRDIK